MFSLERSPTALLVMALVCGPPLVTALTGATPTASAHDEAPSRRTRELVRIQGHLGEAPAGIPVARRIELLVLGQERPFFATQWQQFGLGTDPSAAPDAGTRIALQGDRGSLARLGQVRPSQQVTVLAERRQGASDLFLLALDICPPE